MTNPKAFPFVEVCEQAERTMNKGAKIYQQFWCENCGTKQTMDQANKFFTCGQCEECSHVTDLVKNGCNYMAHFELGG